MRCFWQLGCTVFECEFVDDSVALNVKRLGIPGPDARPDVTVSRRFPRAHGAGRAWASPPLLEALTAEVFFSLFWAPA